jgi:Phytanoyl-CoA dioxygenase (PhyH)
VGGVRFDPPAALALVPTRDVERRAVESLRADGIAVVPFAELINDERLWSELSAGAVSFAQGAATRARHDLDRPSVKNDYLIRRFGGVTAMVDGKRVASLPSGDPLIRFGASDPILNITNAYRGSPTKLVDVDTWYTVPFPAAGQRVASQRWHRDPEDQHVVKVFVYFTDVDEDAGPFQYIRSSAQGGRYGELWSWSRAMSSRFPWARRRLYPSERRVEKRIPASDVATVVGPAGTVIICDTSGLHRGGFAIRRPRVLSYHTYVSPGARGRCFDIEWGAAVRELSDQGRFALE